MRLLIITHAPRGSTKGNRITAERWAIILRSLGHDVQIATDASEGEVDCMIALHATQSSEAIIRFQSRFPERPVILCLTGTDLHLDLQRLRGEEKYRQSLASIEACSHLVLLEPEGARALPANVRDKATVIMQSAVPVAEKPKPRDAVFEISLLGHLREEKDPFLAAHASRNLPTESIINIIHAGSAIDAKMEEVATGESKSNPRYHWVGPVTHDEAQQIIARSRLMVLTSKIEGAPSVISEAIVNGVPILGTRISATVGLLGHDYPGLFPVADADGLTALMLRAETDSAFLAELQAWILRLAPQFTPDVERIAIDRLLKSAVTPNI